ncbi:hypothetical protein BJ878DRAFT_571598, partial [Calycina marina]
VQLFKWLYLVGEGPFPVSARQLTRVIELQCIGLATSLLGSVHGLGGAVAQSLYADILTNKLDGYLHVYVAPAVVSDGLPSS